MEFEDDWEDEFEQEIVVPERDANQIEEIVDEDEDNNFQTFTGTYRDLKEDEKLEYFNEAYQLFHKASSEWPCLSVDFVANF